MEFTTDWFTESFNAWSLFLPHLKPESYLEVGCFEGRSMCTVLSAVRTVKRAVAIDPWENYPQLPSLDMATVEKRFDKNVREALAARDGGGEPVSFHKYKATSLKTLAGMLLDWRQEKFDLVYIDGSHMPEAVLMDMMLAFRLLNTGGVMVVDDYLWRPDPKQYGDLMDTPRLAVDAFSHVMSRYAASMRGLPLYQRAFIKVEPTP